MLHLPPPGGDPDRDAAEIIDLINGYLDGKRHPVEVAAGLRHILWHAEHGWNEALTRARQVATYREITEPTGDAFGTVQARVASHLRRKRQGRTR